MNQTIKESTSYQLEQLIDKFTLPQIVDQLAVICREKADHLRVNWQDNNAARLWDRNANKLEMLSGKLYS